MSIRAQSAAQIQRAILRDLKHAFTIIIIIKQASCPETHGGWPDGLGGCSRVEKEHVPFRRPRTTILLLWGVKNDTTPIDVNLVLLYNNII